MRVLVTGASGFLGGRLVQMLAQHGYDVTILIRKSSNISHLEGYSFTPLLGDLSDESSLVKAVQGCEIVFHCAALSTDWAPWNEFYGANVLGVQHLLRAALNSKSLKRFVHVSTTDVYGYPEKPVDETAPVVDVGLPYNRTKILGEKAVFEAYSKLGFPVTIFRPVSIYGPRGSDFVFRMGMMLKTGGMGVFDGGHTHAGLLFVDNGVETIIHSATLPQAEGQIYNLRDDISVTWQEYLSAFAARLNSKPPRINLNSKVALLIAQLWETTYSRFGIKRSPVLTRHSTLLMCRDQGYDIIKAKQQLGFQSAISFERGLDLSVEWFLRNN
jgi:nucleoside-diphosphate-sugar epimerase